MSCPVEAMFRVVFQRWSAYILVVLSNHGGQLRFNAIKRQIPGISQKVLTDKLRELEQAGLVHRDYQPTIPPTVTYHLTARSRELEPLLRQLSHVAHQWRAEGLI
ncbi:MAG: winged helix-turn-helix transcriptional regulator [Holosporales bacterium]